MMAHIEFIRLKGIDMRRRTNTGDDLATIEARRNALKAELAELDQRAKEAELAARDAGRPTLVAALDKVRIPAMGKAEAKAIATAIAQYGGDAVASHLASIAAT
ncbi:hypothetical protein J2X73_004638 [Novosphingobium sp. 1748]|uniref:hypothetical protein n=1 Tax=Novosphingobium sp. 1748 TaxID=2817760 RepID=UPI0028670F41|nr:hypothetical protein [Novosphingobium sp. 1748]MDR6710233.1 hypothetical protein [Novosphingobium sp. 1748]